MSWYLAAYQLPQERTLLRLDDQCGIEAMLSDLARHVKDYAVLDHLIGSNSIQKALSLFFC